MNYPLLYLEHLSRRDLELLAETAGLETHRLGSRLREDPRAIDDLLAAPELYEAIFADEDDTIDARASTFLAFGVIVNRSARDLHQTSHVAEWSAPGKRLPVFDVEPMRWFLDDGQRRYFLTEFLDSFTKVSSGSYVVRTRGGGYRRRRFSEMDLARMAEVVEMLPPLERPGGYRRLGDIALFLNGVFPDHAATHPLSPVQRQMLVRSAAVRPVDAGIEDGGLRFLDIAGAGWYRRAATEVERATGNGSGLLRAMADRFGEARRVLNFIADRYLFHHHLGWLQGPI